MFEWLPIKMTSSYRLILRKSVIKACPNHWPKFKSTFNQFSFSHALFGWCYWSEWRLEVCSNVAHILKVSKFGKKKNLYLKKVEQIVFLMMYTISNWIGTIENCVYYKVYFWPLGDTIFLYFALPCLIGFSLIWEKKKKEKKNQYICRWVLQTREKFNY